MPNGDGTLTTQSDAVYSGEFTDGQLTDGTYSYQSQDYTFMLHTEPQSSPTFSVRYTDGTEIDGTALDDGYSNHSNMPTIPSLNTPNENAFSDTLPALTTSTIIPPAAPEISILKNVPTAEQVNETPAVQK